MFHIVPKVSFKYLKPIKDRRFQSLIRTPAGTYFRVDGNPYLVVERGRYGLFPKVWDIKQSKMVNMSEFTKKYGYLEVEPLSCEICVYTTGHKGYNVIPKEGCED